MTNKFDAELDDLLLDNMTPAAELQAEHGDGDYNAELVKSLRDSLAKMRPDDPRIGDMKEFIKSVEAGIQEATEPRFHRMTIAELLAMPPKEWLIENVVGKGDLFMLFGGSGGGKTFVTIDMIVSSSVGARFAGRFDVTKPLNIAYCAGEGLSGLSDRFEAAMHHHGVEADGMPHFEFYPEIPQLFDGAPGAIDFIRERQAAQERGEVGQLDMVIVDTMHSATVGAEENSAKEMGVVLWNSKMISLQLGCAFGLVHHSGKGNGGERGSSALRGAMDSMIKIDEKKTLVCDKLKDGAPWAKQQFDLISMDNSVYVEWGAIGKEIKDEKADTNKARTIRHLRNNPGRKYAVATLVSETGINKGSLSKIFSEIFEEKEAYEKVGNFHPEYQDLNKDYTDPNSEQTGRGNPMLYWWGSTAEDGEENE